MPFLLLLVVALVVFVLLVGAFVRPDDKQLSLFGDLYSVPLTAGNVEMVRLFIWRSRIFRAVGAIITIVGYLLLAWATGDVPLELSPFGVLAVGYGAGAIVGELTRPRLDDVRSASLERRTVSDYVTPWVWVPIMVLSLASVLFTALLPVWGSSIGQFDDVVSVNQVMMTSSGLLVLVLLGAAAARRAVQSPDPKGEPDRNAARHAIRSAAIGSVLGASLMTASVSFQMSFQSLFSLQGNVLAGVVSVLGALLGMAGFFLAIRTLPRFGFFRRNLPAVPASGQVAA